MGSLLLAASASAIDFTPIVPENDPPQMRRFPRLLFQDGARTVSYVPPAGWTYSGSAAGLRMEANDPSHSVAILQRIARKTDTPFDGPAIEALVKAMTSALPPGSTEAHVTSTERNPLLLAGHETLEITVSYFLLGKVRIQSVLFVNLPGAQLQFSLTSLQPEFTAAHAKFRRSFYTWQWID